MTPRFVFHPTARAELREARDWYDSQRSGLGAELGIVIDHTLDRIREFSGTVSGRRGQRSSSGPEPLPV